MADEASFCGSTDETEERAGAVTKPLSRPNQRNKKGDQDIEQPRRANDVNQQDLSVRSNNFEVGLLCLAKV